MAKNIKLTQNKEIVMENRELKLHSKNTIYTMIKLRESLQKMKGEMSQTYMHLKNGNQVEAQAILCSCLGIQYDQLMSFGQVRKSEI